MNNAQSQTPTKITFQLDSLFLVIRNETSFTINIHENTDLCNSTIDRKALVRVPTI